MRGSPCSKSKIIGLYFSIANYWENFMPLTLIVSLVSWVIGKPPKSLEFVPIPPLKGDERHSMTTLQYLMELNYSDEDVENSSSRRDSFRLGNFEN